MSLEISELGLEQNSYHVIFPQPNAEFQFFFPFSAAFVSYYPDWINIMKYCGDILNICF